MRHMTPPITACRTVEPFFKAKFASALYHDCPCLWDRLSFMLLWHVQR